MHDRRSKGQEKKNATATEENETGTLKEKKNSSYCKFIIHDDIVRHEVRKKSKQNKGRCTVAKEREKRGCAHVVQ